MNSYTRKQFMVLSGMLGIAKSVLPATPATDLEKIKLLLRRDEPVIWLFTGDSITQGAKHTAGCRSYPEIFSERVRWEIRRFRDIIINTAISGNKAADIWNDFDWRVQQFKPAVVSLMIGTNDCAYSSVTPRSFRDDLISLLDKISSIQAIPLLHTPNLIELKKDTARSRLPEFIGVIREVAREKNTGLVDHWMFWENNLQSVPAWLNDPVHPNGKGHQQLARLLFQSLNIFDKDAFTCK